MDHKKKSVLLGPPTDECLDGILYAIGRFYADAPMSEQAGPIGAKVRRADTWARNVKRNVGLRTSTANEAIRAAYSALMDASVYRALSTKEFEAMKLLADAICEMEAQS